MEETPFEDRVISKAEIDWGRTFWWWYPISRAIQPAIRISSLLLAAAAVWLLNLGLKQAQRWFDFTGLAIFEDGFFSVLQPGKFESLLTNGTGSIPNLGLNSIAYLTFVVVWIALIFAIFGGLLSRRAAVELGQRTIAPWGSSAKIVFGRLFSYLGVAMIHIVAIGLLLIPVFILGWISRFGSIAAVIAGIVLLAICIPLMFAIGRLVLSLLLGLPFSVCAISVEKQADAFEGFSRSNAYLFQRPVVLALCLLMLVAFGEVGAFLVSRTIEFGWGFILQAYTAANGSGDPSTLSYLSTGSDLAGSLIHAFRFSYFWAAITGLYLVIRRCVDNTDLDEMDVQESELIQNPPRIPTTSQVLAADKEEDAGQPGVQEAAQPNSDSDPDAIEPKSQSPS